MNQDRDRNMRWKRESILQCFREQRQISPSRSGGVQHVSGVEGNEKADEWAKLAADEPDTPGVEWLDGACSLPLPRSLANIGWEISEKK